MCKDEKIKRLERNMKFCKDFSQANHFRPLFIYYYKQKINKLKGADKNA
jgi:hypothetical protein